MEEKYYWINEIGKELEREIDIPFLYSNFKKKEGYKKSIAFSREYGLYRQEYCGCKYSLEESLTTKKDENLNVTSKKIILDYIKEKSISRSDLL